jgi:hypothetical protein
MVTSRAGSARRLIAGACSSAQLSAPAGAIRSHSRSSLRGRRLIIEELTILSLTLPPAPCSLPSDLPINFPFLLSIVSPCPGYRTHGHKNQCKHVQCPLCAKTFCFVCLALQADNGTYPASCGEISTVCAGQNRDSGWGRPGEGNPKASGFERERQPKNVVARAPCFSLGNGFPLLARVRVAVSLCPARRRCRDQSRPCSRRRTSPSTSRDSEQCESARPAAARTVSGGRHQTFSLGGLGTAARSGMRRTRSSCSPAPFLFLQFIFYFSLGSASISHPLSHLPLAVILFSLAHWPGLELSSGGSGSARAPTSITARSSAAVSTGAVVPAGISVRVHAGRSVDRDRRPSS